MSDASRRITLIGAGRMGRALATGWMAGPGRASLAIVDPSPDEEVRLWERLGSVTVNPAPATARTLVLAVKPQVFHAISDTLQAWAGPDTLVLSIMAGIPLTTLEETFPLSRVIRAMPNTPGAVGAGVTLISAPKSADEADIARVRDLLTPLGQVEGPMNEGDLTVATAISGCGPAYAFLLVEAMANAGTAHGLDKDLSTRLARETVIGAAKLLADSGSDPDHLRQEVTSPGGVTSAALSVLMAADGLPSKMRAAVAAAILRDGELAKRS